MADELRHESTATAAGLALAKTDWEDVDIHRFESQATGDIMYASSATQLSRLAAGTQGNALIMGATVPEWFTGLIFSNDGTKTTILGLAGDYTRFGDAGVTSRGLASEDDVLFTGKIEVDGDALLESAVVLYDFMQVIDDKRILFGTSYDSVISYETADANAFCIVWGLPHVDEEANNVPVLVVGDNDIFNVDLGFFNGITQPRVAVVDADRDAYIYIGHSADDRPTIGGSTYISIGDAGATSQGLASEDDLLVTGKLEVDGQAFFDAEAVFGSGIRFTTFYPTAGASGSFYATDTGVGNILVGGIHSGVDPYVKLGRDDTGVAVAAVTDMLWLQAGAGTNNEQANFGLGVSVLLGNDASEVEKRASLDWVITNAADGGEVVKLDIRLMDGGASNLAATLSGAGGLGVDADIGTADDPVALFDKYDDALVLRDGIQRRNRKTLVDRGVFTRKESGSGFMMNIQPMTRLLAGGIYQNRERIDTLAETVESKIEQLESELAELKASLN